MMTINFCFKFNCYSYILRYPLFKDFLYYSHHFSTIFVEAFTCEQVIVDLKNQGIVLGKRKKEDVAEESRFAYKDIDEVMKNQKDLVEPIKQLFLRLEIKSFKNMSSSFPENV